jgi:glycine hydroxymethyltransferase
MVVDPRGTTFTGADAETRLAEIGIVANRIAVPYDERPPMVMPGLRLGTSAGTRPGPGRAHVAVIPDALGEAASRDSPRARVHVVAARADDAPAVV